MLTQEQIDELKEAFTKAKAKTSIGYREIPEKALDLLSNHNNCTVKQYNWLKKSSKINRIKLPIIAVQELFELDDNFYKNNPGYTATALVTEQPVDKLFKKEPTKEDAMRAALYHLTGVLEHANTLDNPKELLGLCISAIQLVLEETK